MMKTSLQRTIAVLDIFRRTKGPLTIKAVAKQCNLPYSTAARTIAQLVKWGEVIKQTTPVGQEDSFISATNKRAIGMVSDKPPVGPKVVNDEPEMPKVTYEGLMGFIESWAKKPWQPKVMGQFYTIPLYLAELVRKGEELDKIRPLAEEMLDDLKRTTHIISEMLKMDPSDIPNPTDEVIELATQVINNH